MKERVNIRKEHAMTSRKVAVGALLFAMALLAAMGCWFCWRCPSRYLMPHDLFWRQVVANGLGLAVFAAAWLAGWRRLLKAAPWLMGIWLLAFVAAKLGRPINGVYRWICISGVFPRPFDSLNINVMTCFVPVFALFVAWLHERKWIRRWMEWGFLAVLVVCAVCYVLGSENRMMRIVAFLHPSEDVSGYLYMGEQMQSAVSVSNWFGNAGRGLRLLPNCESDGMMAASALLFGKWFPALVCALFGLVGASLTALWCGAAEVSKRRYLLFFTAWLFIPAICCHFQTLGLLPVMGFSPALVGASGTAVAMAWFGMGAALAIGRAETQATRQSQISRRRIMDGAPCLGVAGLTLFAVSAIAWAPKENRMFYDKVPSSDTAHIPHRGVIFAADNSVLSCPEWRWSYHLDPMIPADKDAVRSCAKELAAVFEIPEERLLMDFLRTDSRYIPLKDVAEDSIEEKWYCDMRGWRLKLCGLIREPIQGRCYELGDVALPVVGIIHRTLPVEEPRGACGLEYLFEGDLKAKDGISGDFVHATIVPSFQKKVDEVLADACISNKASAAWGVIMKVPSGEIVAMASVKSGTNGVVHTSYNGSAHCNFEPGDLMKPISRAIAMNEGLVKDGEAFDLGGVVSNVGAKKFHQYLSKLGFGSEVGGRTVYGEEAGIFADAGRWNETACDNIAMGRGVAVTGLQIAQVYATLANHGRLVKPRLVSKVTDRRSMDTVKDFMSATNETVQVISPSAADSVRGALESGTSAAIPMVVDGKYSATHFIAVCAGVFPVDNLEYVSVIALEKADKEAATGGAIKSVWKKVAVAWRELEQ